MLPIFLCAAAPRKAKPRRVGDPAGAGVRPDERMALATGFNEGRSERPILISVESDRGLKPRPTVKQ
jgi:hypothetical protein